jgi:5-formyltetrahydrofolate cyclo-ligase
MNKTSLRKLIKCAVKNMLPKQKQSASEAVCNQLSSIASVATADSIFVYLPLEDEVNLMPLLSLWIEESRTICVPLIDWENNTMRGGLLTSLEESALIDTRHSIREPIARHPLPSDYIDVILVPGIAFDQMGGRLGRGGGFYDRYLAQSRPPIVLGVCFDEQLVDCIPRKPHDQEMNAIVTPTRAYFE